MLDSGTDNERIHCSILWILAELLYDTYKEAAELYSMGLTRIQEHTKMAGATYKMGNKVLVNTDIFEAYLEQYRIPGDYEGMAKKFTPDLVELYR